MNSLKLIEALSNAYGACGFEDEVVEIAEKYAQTKTWVLPDTTATSTFILTLIKTPAKNRLLW